MSVGLGHLQWAPRDFWRATPREFFAACDGYVERIGGGKKSAPMTKDEAMAGFAEIERQQQMKAAQ